MPTLNWIGKDKVINHHMDVPYKILEHQYGFDNGEQSSTATNSGNKIIHGDNLEALKALLPEYEGKIKCIYIDPPYNTGKDEWKYSDKVDHPKIKAWLNKTVGKEGEDLSRHDKWLCMMYPRLKLLYKLLTKDGIILISIDNNELYSLKLILDEIFGTSNFIGNIVWKNATDNNPTQIANEHEYLLCYSKSKKWIESEWKSPNLDVKDKLLKIGDEFIKKYPNEIKILQKEYSKWFSKNKAFLWPFDRYKYIDYGGVYTGSQSVHNPGKEGYRYDVIHPETKKPCKEPLMGYRFPWETMKELLDSGKILFGINESKIIELKLYAREYRAKLPSVIELDGRKGAYTLKDVFAQAKAPFKNPKTTELLEEILSFVTKDDDIMLDSFAGSATSAHALLNLNNQDGNNRRFILIEMEDYAEELTAERIRRVITGYGKAKVEGIKNGFDFYKIGKPLFLENDTLNEDVGIEKIREYVWFSETRKPYKKVNEQEEHLLGVANSSAYYFYYFKDELTTLDDSFLRTLKTKAEQYIIYADNCVLDNALMQKYHITFKKIPRDITRF